jgi:hypothetical protein
MGYEQVWFFGNMPDKFFDDEMQPFDVLTVDGKCILAVAIEGDMTKMQKGETPRTGEFFLAKEYLTPKIAEMFEDSNSNLSKLLDKMRRPSFLTDLNNNIGPGSTVTFIAGDGQVLTFGHNNTLLEQDWGWSSRSYGFGAEAAPAAEVKKGGLGSRLTGAAKNLVDNVSKAVKPANATPTARTENTVISSDNTGVMMAPPPECDTKAKKRDWYVSMIGACPEGYKNGPKVLVPKDKIVVKDFATAKEVMSATTDDKGIHHISTDTTVSKEVAENALPIAEHKAPLFPVEQKKAITGLMDRGKLLKVVDINSTEIIEPKTIEAFEKKHPNFFQQSGVDRTHVDRWPFEQLLVLAKVAPEALAVMAMTYRNESIKLGGPKKFSTAQQEFSKQQPVKHTTVKPQASNTPAKNVQTQTTTAPQKKVAGGNKFAM